MADVVPPPVTAPAAPRAGMNTSRRAWKKPEKQRASAKSRPASAQQKGTISRFNVQKAYRKALEVAKATEKARAEDIAAKKQDLKRKREEKEKRRAENELKSSSYQVVRVQSRPARPRVPALPSSCRSLHVITAVYCGVPRPAPRVPGGVPAMLALLSHV